MSCGLKGNRRSGVALVMRHRIQWFIHLRTQGLCMGDENLTNTTHGVWYSLFSTFLPVVTVSPSYTISDVLHCTDSFNRICQMASMCTSVQYIVLRPIRVLPSKRHLDSAHSCYYSTQTHRQTNRQITSCETSVTTFFTFCVASCIFGTITGKVKKFTFSTEVDHKKSYRKMTNEPQRFQMGIVVPVAAVVEISTDTGRRAVPLQYTELLFVVYLSAL